MNPFDSKHTCGFGYNILKIVGIHAAPATGLNRPNVLCGFHSLWFMYVLSLLRKVRRFLLQRTTPSDCAISIQQMQMYFNVSSKQFTWTSLEYSPSSSHIVWSFHFVTLLIFEMFISVFFHSCSSPINTVIGKLVEFTLFNDNLIF